MQQLAGVIGPRLPAGALSTNIRATLTAYPPGTAASSWETSASVTPAGLRRGHRRPRAGRQGGAAPVAGQCHRQP